MNFQQLRIIRETVRRNFNLTEVADALATSQSGVSKHIKDLEVELGVELFVRRGKRLLGLTDPGREIAAIVERMLVDAGSIKRIADELSDSATGELTIATTHTQARYVLPQAVVKFRQMYPNVHLNLQQASPAEIARMLLEGRADIGIATEAISDHADLAVFPYVSWRHIVVVPKDHSLASAKALTLADVARFPIVTYQEGFTGRSAIDRAFTAAGLKPDIVMQALDADVIKAYVSLGLGVGIIASIAFDAKAEAQSLARIGDDLFEPLQSHIALRKGHYLRGYAYRFIEGCQPELKEALVRARLDGT